MLNLNSILIGSKNPTVLIAFYEKVLGKKPDMMDEKYGGWLVGSAFLSVGPHSEVGDMSREPGRLLFNFETKEVKEEFKRISELGAKVVKEPYQMDEGQDFWIATFADPDGNYFQLMSPWEPGA